MVGNKRAYRKSLTSYIKVSWKHLKYFKWTLKSFYLELSLEKQIFVLLYNLEYCQKNCLQQKGINYSFMKLKSLPGPIRRTLWMFFPKPLKLYLHKWIVMFHTNFILIRNTAMLNQITFQILKSMKQKLERWMNRW